MRSPGTGKAVAECMCLNLPDDTSYTNTEAVFRHRRPRNTSPGILAGKALASAMKRRWMTDVALAPGLLVCACGGRGICLAGTSASRQTSGTLPRPAGHSVTDGFGVTARDGGLP